MTEIYPHISLGAFGIYHGADPDSGQALVLIAKRGAYFKDVGKDGFGVPGGFVDLADGEQPEDAAIRELGEEIRDDKGRPVLQTVTPERLHIVQAGINYADGVPGTLHAGGGWVGFACRLDAQEMTILKAYIQKLEDEDYKAAMQEGCNHEVETAYLVPPQTVIANVESGAWAFTYAHECDIAVRVARSLLAAQPTLQVVGSMKS